MLRPKPDRFQPSLSLLPIQNARTAFKPVRLPVILTVPFSRDPITRTRLANAEPTSLRFFIAEAPGSAKVAGFENRGLLIPPLDRFSKRVLNIELADVRIDIEGRRFFDAEGEEKQFAQAKEGDTFEYQLLAGQTSGRGVIERIPFFPDAEYFDLSPFALSTVELTPPGKYRFVWEVKFSRRVVSPLEEFLCIADEEEVDRLSIVFEHPGKILKQMLDNTPSLYFAKDTTIDNDPLLDFYRPFADTLEDVADEQKLLFGLNFVDRIPAQLIPYLAFLVGIELPFFPGATDNMRRAMLRNARRLQSIRGSKRVLTELFSIFGFTIDIINLWFSRDGNRLIAPGERSEIDPEIGLEDVCHLEPLLLRFEKSGFGQVTIPLLKNLTFPVTVDSFIVRKGSPAADRLEEIAQSLEADIDALDLSRCSKDIAGALLHPDLSAILKLEGVIDFGKVLITDDKASIVDAIGVQPLNDTGIKVDKLLNTISLTFDRFLDLKNSQLYAFSLYDTKNIIVPPELLDFRSNRFDVELLSKIGEEVTSQLLDFLIRFLFKLKAFHSLLRKIIITTEVADIYNVIDFCVGSTQAEAPCTDLGELQTLPPVIPIITDPDECATDVTRGFKPEDLSLRAQILALLKEEHDAWRSLDDKIKPVTDPVLASLSRIAIPEPDPAPCAFTKFGQDRVADIRIPDGNIPGCTEESRKDFDHIEDNRQKICDPQPIPNCFTGRVGQELETALVLTNIERVRCKPCTPMLGRGFYWLQNLQSNLSPTTNSLDFFDRGNLADGLLGSALSRVLAYDVRLHYSDRDSPDEEFSSPDHFTALSRPSLEIERDNLFIPGHRFVSLRNLKEDYINIDLRLKPWDPLANQRCPADIVIDLNPRLVEDTTGEEFLVFDDHPYEALGNGLEADIPLLGTHAGLTTSVARSVFTTVEDRPEIEFDQLTVTEDESICTIDPIFKSATEGPCDPGSFGGTDATFADFIDGYPADVGFFEADLETFDRGATDDDELRELIDLPDDETTDEPELLFNLCSGIRVKEPNPIARFHEGLRLDCGCSKFESSDIPIKQRVIDRCVSDKFLDDDGLFDSNCDQIVIDRNMILNEAFGACSIPLDGTIPSLLTVSEDEIDQDSFGEFNFLLVDSFGIIYLGKFITNDNRVDVTITTLDPRIPGQEPTGAKEGIAVFRDGVVTTERIISEITLTTPIILGQGSEQFISRFKTNFLCGERQPKDPFVFHLDCAIIDDVQFFVKCGAAWAPVPPEPGAAWPEAPAGVQPFSPWINVWVKPEMDLTHICPTEV